MNVVCTPSPQISEALLRWVTTLPILIGARLVLHALWPGGALL
jgi:hypothetical protein